jgi:hypothetical protein
MTEIQLLRPEGLFASPAFSHVAVVPPGATTVYVGGQNAVDQNGELVGGTDVAAQTRQVMLGALIPPAVGPPRRQRARGRTRRGCWRGAEVFGQVRQAGVGDAGVDWGGGVVVEGDRP